LNYTRMPLTCRNLSPTRSVLRDPEHCNIRRI